MERIVGPIIVALLPLQWELEQVLDSVSEQGRRRREHSLEASGSGESVHHLRPPRAPFRGGGIGRVETGEVDFGDSHGLLVIAPESNWDQRTEIRGQRWMGPVDWQWQFPDFGLWRRSELRQYWIRVIRPSSSSKIESLGPIDKPKYLIWVSGDHRPFLQIDLWLGMDRTGAFCCVQLHAKKRLKKLKIKAGNNRGIRSVPTYLQDWQIRQCHVDLRFLGPTCQSRSMFHDHSSGFRTRMHA